MTDNIAQYQFNDLSIVDLIAIKRAERHAFTENEKKAREDEEKAYEAFIVQQTPYNVELAAFGHALLKQIDPACGDKGPYAIMREQELPVFLQDKTQADVAKHARADADDFAKQYNTGRYDDRVFAAGVSTALATGVFILTYTPTVDNSILTIENVFAKAGIILASMTIAGVGAAFATRHLSPTVPEWTDEARATYQEMEEYAGEMYQEHSTLDIQKHAMAAAIGVFLDNDPETLRKGDVVEQAENAIAYFLSKPAAANTPQ